MASRRLLYLCARQMEAWLWRRGALVREAVFAPGEAGARLFARYLAETPGRVFTLLANVAEEGFHLETIPYLRGADRRTVIARKLAQTFFDAPFTAAISLGHEKNRRKDERLLLAALGGPETFKPWIDALRAAEAAVSGIHSLPLVGASLLARLRLPPGPCLLLSVQDQSLRQSFFERGEPRFSRLTPLSPGGGAEELAAAFALESARLQQYLSSQRLIARGENLTAHVLAHPDAFAAIRAHCADTPELCFDVIDIVECARRVGLKSEPRDSQAEPLFLHLLAADPPAAQFAGEELRRGYNLKRLRARLFGAGAAALAAGLLFSGYALFEAEKIGQEAEALRAEAGQARRKYDEIIQSLPRVAVDHETLKSAIETYLAQERRAATPLPLLRELSRGLQAEPAVEIERVDWRIGGADGEADATPGEGEPALPEDAESMTVRGALRLPPEATARQALAAFGHFADALRENAELRVEVARQPVDIASGALLRGGDLAREETAKPRDFALTLTRRIAP
ncbi:MAG: hypothetical protein LBS70_07520 [Candidatus Accumulibacter sp.]|jgi:hypothetical protein|nr:hypothetical protein [Accumulibacter sp.]